MTIHEKLDEVLVLIGEMLNVMSFNAISAHSQQALRDWVDDLRNEVESPASPRLPDNLGEATLKARCPDCGFRSTISHICPNTDLVNPTTGEPQFEATFTCKHCHRSISALSLDVETAWRTAYRLYTRT